MGSLGSTFDFIVVGAGPAGAIVASTLARSKKRPSVLLVEAGGRNEATESRISGNRWTSFFNPELNCGYKTVPQSLCDDRQISYDRGHGLGGSSNINCCLWQIPPKDDFEYLAQLTGDNEWRWPNVQDRVKRLESFYGETSHVPTACDKFLKPDLEAHGTTGPIKVGYATTWEKSMKLDIGPWLESGYKCALECNTGEPIGLTVGASTVFQGYRSTAADALTSAPANLHVITDTPVTKVIFDNDSKTAVGISTRDNQTFHAAQEVILSAGSLATPHILMHSGIGPSDQLEKYNIQPIHNNPFIGTNLLDHQNVMLTWERADHTTDRPAYFRSKEAQKAAHLQWEEDRTGPLSEIACTVAPLFPKIASVETSSEYASLPTSTRDHIGKSTVPHCEFIVHAPTFGYYLAPETYPAATSLMLVLMNPQSRGVCTLQSPDPAVPLLFDPKFFSHPYDRRVAIEATKELLRVIGTPSYAKDTIRMMDAPESDSDEDILKFWRKVSGSTWHMTGTTKMTKSEDEEGACVDPDFRVYGVNKLRVADMGVYPFIPNAHTQSTAYLAGLMAADKLVKEYGLDD